MKRKYTEEKGGERIDRAKKIAILLSDYQNLIFSLCYQMTQNYFEAEDLAQETFVHFFTNLPDYRHIGKAKNFLYTIAGNLCRNYLKKTTETLLDDSELADLAEADEFTSDLLTKLAVEDALKRLPDDLRDVVALYYFQDLKLSEIADILKIGLPLVKYRMKQAKIQLKKYLEQEGES